MRRVQRKITMTTIICLAAALAPPVAAAGQPQRATKVTAKRTLTAKPAPAAQPANKPAAPVDAVPQATPIGNPGEWLTADAYPPEARVQGVEGRTVFSLDIDAGGHITACNITESSLSDLLDSMTCSLLIANGRFKPAVNAAGKPVPGKWGSAMRWKLEEAAAVE